MSRLLGVLVLISTIITLYCLEWNVPNTTEASCVHLRAELLDAIADEIVHFRRDNDYQTEKLDVFVEPHDADTRTGAVVYVYFPLGQIYRKYYVQSNGIIILADNPEDGFSPGNNGWAMQTEYMDPIRLAQFILNSEKETVVLSEYNRESSSMRYDMRRDYLETYLNSR